MESRREKSQRFKLGKPSAQSWYVKPGNWEDNLGCVPRRGKISEDWALRHSQWVEVEEIRRNKQRRQWWNNQGGGGKSGECNDLGNRTSENVLRGSRMWNVVHRSSKIRADNRLLDLAIWSSLKNSTKGREGEPYWNGWKESVRRGIRVTKCRQFFQGFGSGPEAATVESNENRRGSVSSQSRQSLRRQESNQELQFGAAYVFMREIKDAVVLSFFFFKN